MPTQALPHRTGLHASKLHMPPKFKFPLKPKELKPKFYVKETRLRLTTLESTLRRKHGSKNMLTKALDAGEITQEAADELRDYLDWANGQDMKV